ncbi:divalent-cation tolerance protein CutA [Pseudothermotoga thermarum]|uniref:CutA1 divalent ion tolerance protein n=1 Tax=Pseudothermotoga thermarum DSM 5069 TaxID=688269 RepID=F7YUD0_9THEM|nr:divalent-cation tolerance protein CutA [Pseudothermotoga thermarum]AEH51329.1 CutA1 divalent ion tolerance protein [Pseudothermotoga thermarum DSM 5069]
MILIYSTFPSEEKALEVCKKLLEEKLIACYNAFPIKSGYWWNGEITYDAETAVILKTSKVKKELVFKRLKELHPYTTPAIFSIEVEEVDQKYLSWLVQVTG